MEILNISMEKMIISMEILNISIEKMFLSLDRKNISKERNNISKKLFENSKLLILVIEDDKHYSPARIAGNSIINVFRR